MPHKDANHVFRSARAALVVVLIFVFLSAWMPEASAKSPLDGRLGGTLASFDELYGSPSAGNPQDGADYIVNGIGVIFVQFQYAPDPKNPGRVGKIALPESPATVMNIHPVRAAANAATDPDPADWTLAEAQARAKKVLPADATFSKIAISGGRGEQTCSSKALAKIFTSIADAGCEINYVLPTAKTVSYVTMALALGRDSSGSSPANPCAGALEWSQAAGARLHQAQTLLDQVATLAGDDAGAVATLHGIGSQFGDLASAQSTTSIPPVMAVANDRLVAALQAYAGAVNQAADALEAQDASAVDAAVTNLTKANDAVARATTVVQRGLSGCGLEPGTPVATL